MSFFNKIRAWFLPQRPQPGPLFEKGRGDDHRVRRESIAYVVQYMCDNGLSYSFNHDRPVDPDNPDELIGGEIWLNFVVLWWGRPVYALRCFVSDFVAHEEFTSRATVDDLMLHALNTIQEPDFLRFLAKANRNINEN